MLSLCHLYGYIQYSEQANKSVYFHLQKLIFQIINCWPVPHKTIDRWGCSMQLPPPMQNSQRSAWNREINCLCMCFTGRRITSPFPGRSPFSICSLTSWSKQSMRRKTRAQQKNHGLSDVYAWMRTRPSSSSSSKIYEQKTNDRCSCDWHVQSVEIN